ncbi:MAG TPA: hypothetical protein VIK01_09380 [Polyangiaceae bacterium]
MSAHALPEDVLVNSFWNRCALAVLRNDAEAGLELLRDMALCEGKIFLTICEPIARAHTSEAVAPSEKPAFQGRPIPAKFAGRCAVCHSGFSVGAAILYNADQRRAAHNACGQACE